MSSVRDAAEFLVQGADIFAIVSYQGFVDAYPEFEFELPGAPDSIAAWNLFVTVAAVGVAYHAIPLAFPMPDGNDYRREVREALRKLDLASDEAFQSFLGVTNDVAPRFADEYMRAVGVFVLWGIYTVLTTDRPTIEQLRPAAVLGKYIVNEFVKWWGQRDKAV